MLLLMRTSEFLSRSRRRGSLPLKLWMRSLESMMGQLSRAVVCRLGLEVVRLRLKDGAERKYIEFLPGLQQFSGNTSILDQFNAAAYNATNSEDCLYLNVYVPLNATSTSKLPVLFSIYGGNLQSGTGSFAVYNGVPFAAHQNVIVVTPNYRVGVFGFTPSPELDQKNPGFLDQRMALSWVHENIAAFGGDPDAITLEGQSAGAYSVKQLWANPPTPLTFRAAIMQSQSLTAPIDGWPILTQLLNCSTAYSPLVSLIDASIT